MFEMYREGEAGGKLIGWTGMATTTTEGDDERANGDGRSWRTGWGEWAAGNEEEGSPVAE